MQLGSNGAALRQHMWKIFSYCNTKGTKVSAKVWEGLQRAQNTRKGCRVYVQRIRFPLKYFRWTWGAWRLSSFQALCWNEVSWGSETTTVGHWLNLIEFNFLHTRLADTHSSANERQLCLHTGTSGQHMKQRHWSQDRLLPLRGCKAVNKAVKDDKND